MNSENILRHWENPLNVGDIDVKLLTHHGESDFPDCGDVVSIDIRAVNGMIEVVRHTSHGCVLSVAGASMLTDFLKGRPLNVLITDAEMLDFFGGRPQPNRYKCCLLALEAFNNARNLHNSNGVAVCG